MCHFVKECKFLIFFFFSCLMCPYLFRYISFQVIVMIVFKFSSDIRFVGF